MRNVEAMSLFNELVELNEVSDRKILDILNIDLEQRIKDLKNSVGDSIAIFIREKGSHKDISQVPINPVEFVNLYSNDYVTKLSEGLDIKVFFRLGNQFGLALITKIKEVEYKEEPLIEEKPIVSKKAK